MPNPIVIGRKLKDLRGNTSREEVAKSNNISASALAMYENGQRIPRDEIKQSLAGYYGVSVGDLFYCEHATRNV